MRHLPVNLASAPVERVRRARRAVTVAAGVVVAATMLHVGGFAWLQRDSGADAAAEQPTVDPALVAQWQIEVDRLASVADVERARTAALSVEAGNQIIAWRTIPWRSIFADLEEVLPDRVRLELVAPGIDAAGRVRMSMVAAALDTGPLQDLLLSLESHPSFDEIWPERQDAGQDEFVRLSLRALYVAEEPAAEPAEVAGGGAVPGGRGQ